MTTIIKPANNNYYEPVRIFRQPAAHSKDTIKYNKSWQNDHNVYDFKRSNLRKVSDDFNDYYDTKKLRSEFWNLKVDPLIDFDVNGNQIVIANNSIQDNLNFYQISDYLNQTKLKPVRSITVPKSQITNLKQINSNLLLTSHQDGAVNLINSNRDNSSIVKRFNQAKFMKSTLTNNNNNNNNNNYTTGISNTPIHHLDSINESSFISSINESIFIYDLEYSKKPNYLNNFNGLNSFVIKDDNSITLNCKDGLKFIDLRSNSQTILKIGNFITSEFLNHGKIATYEYDSNKIRIFDLRNTKDTTTECLFNNQKKINCKQINWNNSKNEMYVLDSFGNLSIWDMLHDSKYKTFKNGLKKYDNKKSSTNVVECGDMIVRNGDIGKIGFSNTNDGIFGMGLKEISYHKIINVMEKIVTTNPASSSDSENETDVSSIFESNLNLDSPHIKSSYSLENSLTSTCKIK